MLLLERSDPYRMRIPSRNLRLIGSVLVVVPALLSALYFSFIPLNYVIRYLSIDKELGAVLIYVLSLFLLVKAGVRWKYRNYRIIVVSALLLLFPFYAFLRIVFDSDSSSEIRGFIGPLMLNPFIGLLGLYAAGNRRGIMIGLWIMSTTVLLFVVYAMMMGSIVDGQIDMFPSLAQEQVAYQNPGMYLSFLVLIELSLLIEPNAGLTRRFVSLLIIGLATFCIFEVASRSSIVAISIAFLLIVLARLVGVLRGIARKKSVLTFYAVVCSLPILIPLIATQLEETRLVGRLVILVDGGDTSQRIYFFTSAWRSFTENLEHIVFGAGGMAFEKVNEQYPHNILLELCTDYGLVGLILFTAPFFYVLSLVVKGRRHFKGWFNRASVMVFIGYFVIAQFTGTLQTSWELVFFGMLLFSLRNSDLASIPATAPIGNQKSIQM